MSSLLHKLEKKYPDITFTETDMFSWVPATRTITYTNELEHSPSLLIHELAHAVLNHGDYQRDVQLLTMETEAWETAQGLAKTYRVKLSEMVQESYLDTYRYWMHRRSTCPECTATGYQTGKTAYTCPACSHEWRVNEARTCGLKRYKLTSSTPKENTLI